MVISLLRTFSNIRKFGGCSSQSVYRPGKDVEWGHTNLVWPHCLEKALCILARTAILYLFASDDVYFVGYTALGW